MVTPRLQISLTPYCDCRLALIWKETQADIACVECFNTMFVMKDEAETALVLINDGNQSASREHDQLHVVLLGLSLEL
jgi:hypothetical protein